MHRDSLEQWERWPIWALGLSNGLNIALWYILSMARIDAPELPIRVLEQLQAWLPLIVVAGGIAAAVSLDGVLIATIAGMRHGRRGLWSVVTIIGAAAFSAAIAYATHGGWLNDAPYLHTAQAAVLMLYNLHLSQRKILQPEITVSSSASNDTNQSNADRQITSSGNGTHIDGFRCRSCGEMFDSLELIRQHRLADCDGRLRTIKL